MNFTEAKIRSENLRKIIEQHNHSYYVDAKSIISDFEYDLLVLELEGIEKKFPELQTIDSPTQRVGSDVSNEFVQVKHKYPMLSLGNTYSESDLNDFDQRVRKIIGDNFEYINIRLRIERRVPNRHDTIRRIRHDTYDMTRHGSGEYLIGYCAVTPRTLRN